MLRYIACYVLRHTEVNVRELRYTGIVGGIVRGVVRGVMKGIV